VLNDRSLWLIARNVARPSNYVALAQMTRVYDHPVEAASRYFLGRGEYPCPVGLRTPLGPQTVTLFSSHDAITVHEIFCRNDYRSPTPPQVVVDLGSNIGVSALYFLTQSPTSQCELYEPDPRNIPKLLQNLQGFEGRYTLHETAVSDSEGMLPFSREQTGRYGTLDVQADGAKDGTKEQIDVRVEHINTVLDQAVSRHGTVDLLKVDTEGSELRTVTAIEPALLAHVRRIVIEWFDPTVSLEGFDASSSCDTVTFINKQGPSS
jgi:FkbM family methyltransferase